MGGRHAARLVISAFLLALICASLSRSAHAQHPPTKHEAPTGSDQFQRAFFEIILNGTGHGDALVLLDRPDVWVPLELLQRAGLTRAAGRRRELNGEVFVSLQSLAPDLTFTIDEEALAVRMTAGAALFGVHVVTPSSARPAAIAYDSSSSAFINYGLNYRPSGGSDLAGEAAFSVRGAFFGTTASVAAGGRPVRGLTHLMIDRRDRLQRITLGDRFVTTGTLGGSALVGGLTISREFDLDPYFVRYPTLDFSGAVTTPSTVEVYVNDRLVERAQIQPGEFQLQNLPVPNGSGNTRLVIRDAFGRSREISSPYYLTASLLDKGVQEYAYTVGVARHNAALDSWTYRDPVGLAVHRVGVTSALTAGFRVEASPAVVSGGPTLNARLWRMGEVELALGISRRPAPGVRAGSALSVGYAYRGDPFSIGTVARFNSPTYRTLSARPDEPVSRVEANSFVGVRIGSLSLSAQHAMTEQYRQPGLDRRRIRTTVTASTRVSTHVNVFATSAMTRTEGRRSYELSLGLNVALGNQRGATVTYDQDPAGGRAALEVQQALPAGPGLGYRVRTELGATGQTAGRLSYNAAFGRYELDYTEQGPFGTRARSATASAAGGLVIADRRLFLARPIDESFAIVKVPGVAGVRAYASHQEVGRTNRHGYLLVPNLLPYYGNILSIADQDIPFDYAIDQTQRVVAPPYRGGALVSFGRRLQAATGTIVLDTAAGLVVPAFGDIAVTPGQGAMDVTSPIGPRGEFFLEGLPPGRYAAQVQFGGEPCRFTLDVPAASGPIATLGSLVCRLR